MSDRTDINAFYIPATKLAGDNGLKGLANIIIIGKLLKETGFASLESVEAAIRKCVPAKKAAMVDFNINALRLGMEC